MNGNDFLELGWENGEIVVKGGYSSNITQHNNNPSCNNNIEYSQNNKSFNKLEEDFAIIKQEKESTNDEFLHSSTPFKKPEANSKKLIKYLGNYDQRKEVKVIKNFSNFLVPKVFLKSTKPITNEETFAKGSKGIKGFHDQQTSLTAANEKQQLDEENSEAVAIVRAKGKAKSSLLCDEPLISSSSLGSLEASNDSKIMKHEDSDESTYSTRDNEEETEDEVVVKETPAQEGNSVKRKETYNLCEKNHRDIMNKKMRILKELIPNCHKVKKASLLDDAIDYIKRLKLQLQIMSMGNGLCMPQMMLPQLMEAGMCYNPWTPQKLPIPSLFSTNNNNTLLQNMFGSFSNQMLQIPPIIPHHVPNFMPMMIGNNSYVNQLMPNTTPTNMLKHHANSSLTTLDVSDLNAKAELCHTNHAPFNQIPSYYPF